MREKLIELIEQAHNAVAMVALEDDEKTYADAMAMEADHLLANGVIVLPCKVGDTVYKICPVFTFLEIGYQKNARNVIVETKMTRLETIVRCMPYFGTIYFLAREEAEAALRKRGEENA